MQCTKEHTQLLGNAIMDKAMLEIILALVNNGEDVNTAEMAHKISGLNLMIFAISMAKTRLRISGDYAPRACMQP
jgi:hypothetical protein